MRTQAKEMSGIEDEAVQVIAGARDAGVIFICDHASNRVPKLLGDLGLPHEQFGRHIAYDIGAADLTRALARHFGAPAVLCGFSRLVIDVNRGADDPTLVMQLSDGAVIPGNAGIGREGLDWRLQSCWTPYRSAIAALIDDMTRSGPLPALVSIHSFTPVWKGWRRPWEVAILWDNDPRMASPLIESLAAAGFSVGDNEPYDGALEGDTLYDLATSAGLAHVLIEVRQDLVSSGEGVESMASGISDALRPVLNRPEVHEINRFGSRSRQSRC